MFVYEMMKCNHLPVHKFRGGLKCKLLTDFLKESKNRTIDAVTICVHIRIDPATLSRAKVAALVHFNVATYSHFKPAITCSINNSPQ